MDNQFYARRSAGAGEIIGRDTMNDLISRQAAIDALKSRQDNGKGDISRFYNTIIQHDIEAVEQLPPAQPERIKGRWIDAVIPNDNGGLPVQVCDQCNTFFPLAYTGGGHSFCPNCGAKMEVTT